MTHQVEVLILTSDLDFATDRVCRELTSRGTTFLRLNRERLSGVLLALDPVEPSLICRNDDLTWTVGPELRSVWWRQGTFDRNVAGGATVQDQLERSQWSAFMRSMMVFDGARWLNHPAAVYRAETKAVQLAEAARVGFHVPRTVMTNDPSIDRPATDGQPVAIKSVDTLLLRDGPDQLFGYTCIMDWNDAAVADLAAAPLTVQQALLEKIDLRVTVVEDRLWCTSIKRGGTGIEGDWRLTAKDQLEVVDHVLSHEDVDRCRELVASLGLRYGAIDLAVVAGRSWFIEINPTGEWGWLDSETRPIAAAIAEALSCQQ